MKNCIFCKIIKGELPSYKIYEDNEFLAILDIKPNMEGVTLVLTKKHYPSYTFDMPNKIYKKLMLVSKKVAKILEKGLKVKRVAMVMEGMGIDHVHIKLYPLHGIKKKFIETWAQKQIFFNKYKGYISTLTGPKAKKEDLEKVIKKIKSK